MRTSKRIELEGGGYAVALIDDETGDAEIVEHDADGQPVRRTYGRFDPVCARCGSHRLHVEERDGVADEDGNPRPRESYGPWLVCDECQHERPLPITLTAAPG
jgi:hypothetical protein